MRRIAISLLVVLVVATLAAVAGASPQPEPLCSDCVAGFEAAASDEGVNATVAESRVTVDVDEDGSATWTLENRLSEGAAAFRESPDRLEAVGRSLRGEFVSADVDGDTVVLTLRAAVSTERHAGLLVVDQFHHGGYARFTRVNVESFTIRGPAGTVVTNDPVSGQVDGRAVTWTGTTEGRAYEAPRMDANPYVVFGPDRSAVTAARTKGALASASAPLVVSRAPPFVVLTSSVFAVALWLVGAALRRLRPSVDVRRLAALVAVPAVIGALAIAGGVALGIAEARTIASIAAFFSGPLLFGLLVGGLAWYPESRARLRTVRCQWFVAGATLLSGAIVLAGLFAAIGAANVVMGGVRSAALALPFAVMLPLGGALIGGGPGRFRSLGAAGLAFAVMLPLVVNFAMPMGGLGQFFLLVGLLLVAVAFPIVGVPFVVLGWELTEEPTPERPPASRADDM